MSTSRVASAVLVSAACLGVTAGPAAAETPRCAGQRATIVSDSSVVVGTSDDDVIVLTGPARVRALGGDDIICGSNGRDVIDAGSGVDLILGRDGDDELRGGRGADAIMGGEGTDLLVGGAGADSLADGADNTLLGGAGVDSIQAGSSAVVIYMKPEDSLALTRSGQRIGFAAGAVSQGSLVWLTTNGPGATKLLPTYAALAGRIDGDRLVVDNSADMRPGQQALRDPANQFTVTDNGVPGAMQLVNNSVQVSWYGLARYYQQGSTVGQGPLYITQLRPGSMATLQPSDEVSVFTTTQDAYTFLASTPAARASASVPDGQQVAFVYANGSFTRA